MPRTIVFAPEALEHITELYRYIARAASPKVADRYTSAIVTYCERLDTFPLRGNSRDDIRPGLRITHYKSRAVIAFDVTSDQVSIIGVYYGGQDYETILQSDSED